MRENNRMWRIGLSFIFLSILLLSENDGRAQPAVTLVVDPDIRKIQIGGDVTEIVITTQTDKQPLKFTWSLVGAGSLEGDTTNPGIFYIPPDRIDGKSAQATVTVTFTIISEKPTPSPPTETPLFPTKKCDELFKQQRFTTPKDDNAFDCYKAVLEKEIANRRAREQIYEIAKTYKNGGDNAYRQEDYGKAQRYYERYVYVAEYIVNTFGDQRVKQEIQEVQKLLETLLVKRLEQLKQALSENLTTYTDLIEKEKQGSDIQEQIIPVLTDITKLLGELELLYEQSGDPEMLKRIDPVKETHKQFEKELFERTHK